MAAVRAHGCGDVSPAGCTASRSADPAVLVVEAPSVVAARAARAGPSPVDSVLRPVDSISLKLKSPSAQGVAIVSSATQ